MSVGDGKALACVQNASNEPIKDNICLWCGVWIPDPRPGQKHCSSRCRKRAWDAEHLRVFKSPDGKMITTVRIK